MPQAFLVLLNPCLSFFREAYDDLSMKRMQLRDCLEPFWKVTYIFLLILSFKKFTTFVLEENTT